MKTITCLFTVILFGVHAYAAGKPDAQGGDEQLPNNSRWNVRVEVLMAAMPEAKGLEMLPDLRDPAKIESAVNTILKAIENKEATLTGYPMVETLDGERAVAESLDEKRYPSDFEVPTVTATHGSVGAGRLSMSATSTAMYPIPVSFETRNLGTTLEVEPHVIGNGDWISVTMVPQRVALLGFDDYDTGKTAGGAQTRVQQPQFFTSKVTTDLKLRNGERRLIGIDKLPDGQIEFFIAQAVATKME